MAGWQEFAGSTAATCSSCTRSTAGIRRRLIRQRARCSSVDASGRRRARAAVEGSAAAEDRRRGQPRAVDPPLRPPRGAARPAGQPARSAIPSLLPATHGVTEHDLRRLPASLDRLSAVRGRVVDARGDRARLRRIYCSTTGYDYSRTSSCRRNATGCGRRLKSGRFPRARRSDRPDGAARSADPGRGVRAVPAPHVSRQDALLDRRARHARADPRRGDRRSGRSRHPQHPHRHGPSRAPERHGARPEQAVRADSRGVQGSGVVGADSGKTWRGPATSSITPARTARSRGGAAMDLVVSMPPNPSHLEAIDPVVEGMARAAGTVVDTPRRADVRSRRAACRS